MMKNKYLCILMALVSFVLLSCSDEEDTTPTHADINKFAPADEDQSVEAQIRRDFKSKTGSYLLFNDTLSKQRTGEDMYGNPVYKVETLDIGYEMVGFGNSYVYTFDYIKTDAEKQKAAQLVEEKLAKKLGDILPFSLILANRINVWKYNKQGVLVPADDSWNDVVPNPIFVLGSRSLAVSMENGEAYDDDTFFNSMLEDIVYNKLKAQGNSFLQDFYNAVNDYTRVTSTRKDRLGYERKVDDELARSLGFVKDYSRNYFVSSQESDTRQYLKILLSEKQEEYEAEFAAYPICLKRFSVMRAKIQELGFNFDV